MITKLTSFNIFNIAGLAPKQDDIDYVQNIFDSNLNGLKYAEIISKSKLTKARTLRGLNFLIKQGIVVKDEIKNIFYLL